MRGAISAVIATLLDAGWQCPQATKWRRTSGDTYVAWSLAGVEADAATDDLLDDLREDLQLQLWRKAAKHFCGTGLEDGADMTGIRRDLRRLAKQGDMHAAFAK